MTKIELSLAAVCFFIAFSPQSHAQAQPEPQALAPTPAPSTGSAANGQWSLIINGVSKHFDVDPDYAKQGINERNWGLGVQLDLPRDPQSPRQQWLLNAGAYKDSSNGTAVYAGGGWMWQVWPAPPSSSVVVKSTTDGAPWQLLAGVQANAFYSAKYNDGKPFIALLPAFNVGTKRVSVNIAIAPKIKEIIAAGVIFAQIKVPLD